MDLQVKERLTSLHRLGAALQQHTAQLHAYV